MYAIVVSGLPGSGKTTVATALAHARFEARLRDGSRHPVHHAMDDWERFSDALGLLALPAPLVDVDTTDPVDVLELGRRVKTAVASVEQSRHQGSSVPS